MNILQVILAILIFFVCVGSWGTMLKARTHFCIRKVQRNMITAMENAEPPGILGKVIETGDILEAKYSAYVDGSDTILAKDVVGRFTLGDGSMIAGWEEAVQQMTVGSKKTVIIPPERAYGEQGIDGVIPQNASLVLEIHILKWLGNVRRPNTLFQKVPKQVTQDASAAKEDRFAGSVLDIYRRRFSNISFGFGGSNFFSSQTGEAAPWILNPNITFPAMMSVVVLAFLTVFLNGAVREKGFTDRSLQTVQTMQEQSL